ncbi:MAG: hypothetical protein IKR73_07635, partial [Oscillospiraceae bacterium]|nr:hypothetical protein [Oscillospiraceae bacterium]
IREFRVPVVCRFDDSEFDEFTGGSWALSVGEALLSMSAAGHYFAEEIRARLDVPVGLLNTSAGGAPVEARMSLAMLRSYGGYDTFLDKCTKPGYIEDTTAADAERYSKWTADMHTSISDVSAMEFTGECSIPFHFSEREDLRGISGRVWFRRTFEIPDDAPLDDALLSLGTMVDADVVYVNGTMVGETTYMYPPRLYSLPQGLLRHGTNDVYIRLEVHTANGGFTVGKRYCVKLADRIIDLSGRWEYAITDKAGYLVDGTFFQGLPLSLYAMTAPAYKVRCAGLIWYQAESNGDAARYPFLFREFVEMYRRRCGYDIPVVFAQLPNFADVEPGSWAAIREGQRKCLEIPGTAMSVNIDCGESHDLHPLDKWDVGKRLAYAALRLIYHDESVPDSPAPLSAHLGDDITIHMSKAVTADHTPLQQFTVYDGGSEYPASASIDGDTITVTFDKSITPVRVRYLYEDDPKTVELYCDGIPVTPFEIELKK